MVHHRDRNPLNDALENLVALTRAEHALEHAAEVQAAGFGSEEARRRARSARLGR
ncbi:HNH endonuclease [Methylobacterium organophilum]|uniref:HNH endonuclease n=1 Tax=Methylobacterium organophilum TaxID=410 RepID=UPI003570BE5F